MKVTLVAKTKPEIEGIKNLGEFIAYCARVSNPANQMNSATAPKLLAYLIKHRHWSPFEMANIAMEIETTRDISHQIIRHVSFRFQEFSQRYAEVDSKFVLREARLQDKKNRQNSIETSDSNLEALWVSKQAEVVEKASLAYQWALENGVAKEQARVVLPEGLTPTKLYMNGSVRSWIHFCEVRTDPSTQKEHREVAQACADILAREGIECQNLG